MQKQVSELSAEELEQLLAAKKKEAKEKELLKRQEYEVQRNIIVQELIANAVVLNEKLSTFKKYALKRLETFKDYANDYGKIRSNSQGGFSLRSMNGDLMVSYDRNTKPVYDERASQAETLLKEFLEDTVKKADKKTYRTLSALMERNKKGDYNPTSIASLVKIEDNYDDPRWLRALKLFKESFQILDISYSVSFYKKDEQCKDQLIPLSITSV
jgi:hypothetical protein